jgi:cytoskeleton protein RodZ
MSEDATTPPDGGADAPLAGERLAHARLLRDVSIQEIANALHLDEYKVRALEQNEFEKLGAPVFAKGYLRKYAALVGVSVDDILADYYRLNHRPTGAPLVIPTRVRQPRDLSPGPWLGGFAVAILVAGAAWWWLSAGSEWFDNRTEPGAPAPFADDRSAVPIQQPAGIPETETETAGPDPAGQPESADVGPPQSGPAERQSGAEQPQTGGPSQVELRLTFSGDCWTEVTDASGERLYFGLGSAGRAVTVSGEPPLQVLLGNSANATLAVNGSSYPVPQSARRGDTARLTITDL